MNLPTALFLSVVTFCCFKFLPGTIETHRWLTIEARRQAAEERNITIAFQSIKVLPPEPPGVKLGAGPHDTEEGEEDAE